MQPICFDCLGCVHPTDFTFNPMGILCRGELNRIIQKENDCSAHLESCKLFDIHFVDDTMFVNNMETIFNIVRQKYALISRCISKQGHYLKLTGNNARTFWLLRLEICKFFMYLKNFTKRIVSFADSEGQDSVLSCILKNVKTLIIATGQMSDIPNHLILNLPSRQGNECQSCLYHFLHLQLDIRWHFLTFFLEFPKSFLEKHHAEPLFPKSEFHQVDMDISLPFEQYAQLLLWDLIGIAVAVFRKVSYVEYHLMTPFPCTCIRELWVLVLHLLDDRQKKECKDSFWVTLHSIFHVILQEKIPVYSSYTSVDDMPPVLVKLVPDLTAVSRLGFCWWILLHISSLYQIDFHGNLATYNQVDFKSNYFEVSNLIKLTIDSVAESVGESQLRCYLTCCISVCKLWEVSIETPVLLWEFFYKRLNDAFMEAGELTAHVPQGKSGLAWLKHIKVIIDETAETSGNLNSYQLFLRLLSVQLRKSRHAGSDREWKQLKGRIFAKFHPRKMLELNRSGLNNCFCLFLTLASLADLDDVVAKICDILDLVNPDILEPEKYCIIWRGMFALMLIGEEQQHDLAVPAQKIADDFNILARQISETPSNSVQTHMVSALINVYLEGLQDVFEHSTHLNLSEYILIASGFSELLSHSPPSDVQLALVIIEVILARHKIMHKKHLLAENGSGEMTGETVDKEHYEALTEALCLHVLPLLKEQTIGKVPHQLLASVASAVTIMMLDTPTKPCPWKESFKTFLQYFGINLQTNAELCCKYLINLLSQPKVVERMDAEMPDCQAQIIRSWFRLGMQIPTSSLDYQDITRLVFKLPEVVAIFSEAELECQPPFNSQTSATVLFLQALEIQDLKKTRTSCHFISSQRINIYLVDIIPVSNMALKSNVQSQITQVYAVVGNVVGLTSSLIYEKGKPDCLLNDIVSCLLLPPVVYNQSKMVPAAMLTSLKDNFHLFIAGIATLGFRRDPFINRILKDVFIHYLPRFSLKSASVPGTPMHPLVVSLLNILKINECGPDVFLFSVEVIRDHYLPHFGTAKHLEMGLNFMSEILSRITVKDSTLVCPVLLPALLKLLLLSDNQSMKQKTLDLVKIVDITETNEDQNCRCLKSSLREVLGKYFGTHHERVFQMLGLLVSIFPLTIRQLVPYLAERISETEQKKGVGQDSALRLKYGQFLTDSNLIFTP